MAENLPSVSNPINYTNTDSGYFILDKQYQNTFPV